MHKYNGMKGRVTKTRNREANRCAVKVQLGGEEMNLAIRLENITKVKIGDALGAENLARAAEAVQVDIAARADAAAVVHLALDAVDTAAARGAGARSVGTYSLLDREESVGCRTITGWLQQMGSG